MEENLKKTFKRNPLEAGEDLPLLIWSKITKIEKSRKAFKIYLFSALGIFSALGFIPVFKMLLGDLSTSGFYEYASLAFSNVGTFSSYWKELAMSISEAIPLASLIYSFIFIFLFFFSIRFVIKQIINNKYMGNSYAY